MHKDDDPLVTGTHKGASGSSTLIDRRLDFRACGVSIGLAIYNDTQSTNGLVTVVTENKITDDTNTWDTGDTYEIYKTATKDSIISSIWTDKRFGRKVTNKAELDRGILHADIDIDRDEEHIFGPGFPEKRG
ncbi:MAG: hypothetical protein JRI26_04315 [Deltaproteobacteria bacterium]|nr:hypothetical protein [Deltaproteobacteria bacterium]